MTLALLCAALIAATPADDPSELSRSYREAKAKADRSPEGQVRLALWCEAHGLTAERLHHLSLAVLADPKNAVARGLMGLVSLDGRWRRPEAVADQLKADPNLEDYQAKRLKAEYTADAQYALGVWCDEHGLKEQARAHLTAVTRLDPRRESAWKKLGYKKHGSRWATDAQIAAEEAEAEAQKRADRTWRPILDRYKSMLDRPKDRAEAEAGLLEVTDPRAVPAILHAFGKGRAKDQLRAVQLLGQVDAPSASRALAGLAVLSPSAEARRVAIETLRGRDPRDFVRLWIALIRKPIKYEVKPVGGPGEPGTLLVEGENARIKRVYSPPSMPTLPNLNAGRITYDANGLPVLHVAAGNAPGARLSEAQFRQLKDNQDKKLFETVVNNSVGTAARGDLEKFVQSVERSSLNPFNNVIQGPTRPDGTVRYTPIFEEEVQIPVGEMIRETQMSAIVAQKQLTSDVALLDRANAEIRRDNEPIALALKTITGGDLGDDGPAWDKWWTDRLGYAITSSSDSPLPTYVQDVPIEYVPSVSPSLVSSQPVGFVRTQTHSCFAAGTTVRTIDGEKAIEAIRAGDLVLTQDTKGGGLAYRAVVAAYHNPPNATLRVKLGEETVVATGIHRFWKVGRGWTMARELKAGDLVRTLGGVAKVESVEDDKVQPVFNLEVAEGHSFLVGRLGALVHDNSLVEATPEPFDAAPAPAAKVSQ